MSGVNLLFSSNPPGRQRPDQQAECELCLSQLQMFAELPEPRKPEQMFSSDPRHKASAWGRCTGTCFLSRRLQDSWGRSTCVPGTQQNSVWSMSSHVGTAWGAPWRLSGWSCNQEVTCSPLDQVILASSVRTARRTWAAGSTQCAGGACCPCEVLAGGDPGQTAALEEGVLLGMRTLKEVPCSHALAGVGSQPALLRFCLPVLD